MKKDRLSTFLGCTSPLSPLMLASAGFLLFVSDLCLKNYVLYNKLDALKKIMTLLSILMCIVLAIEATGSVKNRKSVKLENKKNVNYHHRLHACNLKKYSTKQKPIPFPYCSVRI